MHIYDTIVAYGSLIYDDIYIYTYSMSFQFVYCNQIVLSTITCHLHESLKSLFSPLCSGNLVVWNFVYTSSSGKKNMFHDWKFLMIPGMPLINPIKSPKPLALMAHLHDFKKNMFVWTDCSHIFNCFQPKKTWETCCISLQLQLFEMGNPAASVENPRRTLHPDTEGLVALQKARWRINDMDSSCLLISNMGKSSDQF